MLWLEGTELLPLGFSEQWYSKAGPTIGSLTKPADSVEQLFVTSEVC